MKTILLLVHEDEGQEARLQSALDVARVVDGHLKCLDVAVIPVFVGDFYSGAGEAMLLADERRNEADNRARIEARLADTPEGTPRRNGQMQVWLPPLEGRRYVVAADPGLFTIG